MNTLPLLLYAAAGVAYAIHFARRDSTVGRAATTLLLFGALVHTFVIGMQTMEVRHLPFANFSRAVSSFVWLLTLSYLYLELTTDERSMGVFILPVIIGLQLIPVLHPGVERADPVLDSPWFWVHVSSLLFAYASFALAGVLGVTYMLQFKEIKKKHLGYFYTRLPSLQILDIMNSRAVTVGLVFLTFGVIVGAVWTAQARTIAPDDPNLRAMSIDDPKIFVALLTWGVYSFAIFARRTWGWTGRRAAWLSSLGFAFAMVNFLAINYFVTTSHTFY
ncbi:MAG TPA: cytochrome c biogenesis protein CcsA [Vicinamibacterales bacterium]|nr:cytochrome c biogenesis protein CcsA [Vicinamibacterales bacterium]